MGERRQRLRALLGLAVARTRHRLQGPQRRRLLVSVLGVAVAVALVVTVTGVSVGLASNTTVYGSSVDYWIVPESASASTMAVSVGGPSLGQVHASTDRIESIEGVDAATPVAVEVVRLEYANRSEYVLLAGVLGRPGVSVLGADAGDLTPGDPHYANGTYAGPWTGDLVVSPATADLLEVEAGDEPVTAAGDHSFSVVAVGDEDIDSGVGSLPTAVAHLSEVQAITGQADADAADQILVRTDRPAVANALEQVYPHSQVVSGSGGGLGAVTSADLPLAVALLAFLVALAVGSLFVATAMGMEVTADRTTFATLDAVGFSTRSQLTLVTVQTVVVTLLGGALGVGLGWAAIAVANRVARHSLTTGPIAVFDPLVALAGVGLAVVMGLLTVPYLAYLVRRTSTLERLEA